MLLLLAKQAALVALVALALTSAATSNALTTSNRRRQGPANRQYCRPGQACWPTAADWSALNSTIGGRLVKVTAWPSPCFDRPGPADIGKCQVVKDNYLDDVARADQIGITENDNWSVCYTQEDGEEDCSLTAIAPQLGSGIPFSRTCKLGRISPYAVKVSSAADIAAAIKFADSKNVKLVVKNTGHEYAGRASAPDSLLLWTHQLKSIQFTDNFRGGPAFVLGSGVQASDVYKAAADRGYDITLGAYGTVGVAGGFAMGGGHGPFGPKYGLAVDNVLQYKIVTADGQELVANADSNSDLYWALRGGGGGVWGVVTEVVYRLHPALKYVGLQFDLEYKLLGNRDAAMQAFLEKMAEYQSGWTKFGWSGYTFFNTRRIKFAQGAPTNDFAAAQASMKPIIDYVKANSDKWSVKNYTFKSYDKFQGYFSEVMDPLKTLTPVAFSERLGSRLIPTSQFSTPASRTTLAKAVVKALNDNIPPLSAQAVLDLVKPVDLQIYSTGPVPEALGGPAAESTGLNPAWRSMYWSVTLAVGWTYGFQPSTRTDFSNTLTKAVDNLRAFGTGAYYSESDVLERDWQTVFFGSHYQRLVDIKRKYDPKGLFTVFKGIGYEGQENQNAFRCYKQA